MIISRLKKILYFLTYRNFRANFGIFVFIVLSFIFLCCSLFGHVELHFHRNPDILETEKKYERIDNFNKYIESEKKEVQKDSNLTEDEKKEKIEELNNIKKSERERILNGSEWI